MPYQLDQIDPTKTVMIVVDMQNDFVAEGAKLRSAAAAAMVLKLASTLKFCREKGIKIIYTAHVHRRDGSDMGLYDDLYPPIADHSTLVDGTPGVEIFSGLAPAPGERARRCPACGLLAFPRLAPAVITLVERDGEALLARGATFPIPMYSCIAGFVEPGETLEDAVHREVHEEVGVELSEVTYIASQPWPFPHSLMIGFEATWASGDIEVDGKEILDAQWYRADDLPTIPPPLSIARTLIDRWIARRR